MSTCTVCNCEYNDGSCECAPPECDHTWEFVSDWEGDPRVINGTHDISHFECAECGETRDRDDPRMRRWWEDRQPQYEKEYF